MKCFGMERISLVYCTKCGAENEDNATVCTGCGAPLAIPRPIKKRQVEGECFGPSEQRRMEDACFGLPYGGAIAGILFGIIIVFLGLAIYTGYDIMSYLGPLFLVIIGILIIAGALYGLRHRY
jgi:hypothetical protein